MLTSGPAMGNWAIQSADGPAPDAVVGVLREGTKNGVDAGTCGQEYEFAHERRTAISCARGQQLETASRHVYLVRERPPIALAGRPVTVRENGPCAGVHSPGLLAGDIRAGALPVPLGVRPLCGLGRWVANAGRWAGPWAVPRRSGVHGPLGAHRGVGGAGGGVDGAVVECPDLFRPSSPEGAPAFGARSQAGRIGPR